MSETLTAGEQEGIHITADRSIDQMIERGASAAILLYCYTDANGEQEFTAAEGGSALEAEGLVRNFVRRLDHEDLAAHIQRYID